MADKLLVRAGDVIDVQLTSETVVIEGADRRQVEQTITVREADGQRRAKFDFEDTELGVRETQRVVIVRGQGRQARSWAVQYRAVQCIERRAR
jgi:hypothetical protein